MSPNLEIENQNYSQGGEDGIIEHLVSAINIPNKVCVEIGWGNDGKKARNGLAVNCTQNLVQNNNYTCFAFDAKPQQSVPKSVNFYNTYVTPDNVDSYFKKISTVVDFFSLDIDSYDFAVMEKLFSLGFSPTIICAEINRSMKNDFEFSFPYITDGEWNKKTLHGVSIKKYITFLESQGYTFFTLCSTGVNAFFYKSDRLDTNKLTTNVLHEIPHIQEAAMSKDDFYKMLMQHEYWKNHITLDMFK
jgi:hypothetical protein